MTKAKLFMTLFKLRNALREISDEEMKPSDFEHVYNDLRDLALLAETRADWHTCVDTEEGKP